MRTHNKRIKFWFKLSDTSCSNSFLSLYVLLNSSVCVLSALALNSNGLFVCVRKGTKELYFRPYLDDGVIMIMLPLFSVLKRKLQKKYHISSRYINVVDIFVSHCKWCKPPDSKYFKIFYILCLSLLQFASHFCKWNEISEHYITRDGTYSIVVDFNISHCFHQKWLNWPLFPLGSRLELRPTR